MINFPYTILHPYFMPEVAKVLNQICPGCKSSRHTKIKVRYHSVVLKRKVVNLRWFYCVYFGILLKIDLHINC